MNKKVVIGLSGGVDSSVALHLLKEQGYECVGVTMKVWDETETEDAGALAKQFGIEYRIVDFRERFKSRVQDYFVNEYLAGRTPNPCTVCNRHVKLEALLSVADEVGADYVATGHYARIKKLDNGRYTIMKTPTAQKEQTYALFRLSQEQLARIMMPVGEYTKDEIRNIARDMGIDVADKPDSQEICFIPDNDYAGFIGRYTGKECEPGNFVDTEGKILGRHKGIIHYTVGQRKGLNLSLGRPAFVVELRPETNEVVIGTNEDVFSDTLYAGDINYMGLGELPPEGITAIGKIRYAHAGAPCRVVPVGDDRIKVVFDEPQRAITPGQAVVLYDGDKVLLGGTILRQE